MEPRIHICIETTAEEAEIERKAATAETEYNIESITPLRRAPDSPLVEARFVDPVMITATATLALIAVRLVNHLLKSNERGIQIDLRTQPTTLSHLRNVPAGLIVVIDKEGNPSIHRPKYTRPEDLLPTLAKIFNSTPSDE